MTSQHASARLQQQAAATAVGPTLCRPVAMPSFACLEELAGGLRPMLSHLSVTGCRGGFDRPTKCASLLANKGRDEETGRAEGHWERES
nr:unnamed protein product [Digitaria exilis]